MAEAVRNELSLLLLRDAGDPRLAGVAISRVVVTPDLKQGLLAYFTLPAGMASNLGALAASAAPAAISAATWPRS